MAVKQFRLDLPPENAHRFVDALERLIAADLTHLGIAAPLAAGITENSPFLALDFVAAESFDVVTREYGSVPVAEALRLASQLGGALDFAAAVNVYHGALHPRDVLVSTDETRVTGLGIAQVLDSLGVASPVRRPYTSPERVAGAAWDRRADIFSLAALVFEMLFGRRVVGVGAFAAESVTPIDGADQRVLRAIFTRALAEEPAGRFDTALEFAGALHGALQQSTSLPKPARTRRRDTDGRSPWRTSSSEPELPLILAADREPEPSADAVEAPLSIEPDLSRTDAHVARALMLDADQPDAPSMPDEAELDLHVANTLADDVALEAHDDGPHNEPVLVERDRSQGTAFGYAAALTETAIEESRSAVWPIVLALTVGLLVGFAGGYGVANRDRTVLPTDTGVRQSPVSSAPAAAAPSQPSAAVPVAADAPPRVEPAPVPVTPAPALTAAVSAPPARVETLPRAQTPAPPRAAAPAARVTVRSAPSGARVTVDGRDAGTTPLTLDNLARGAHVVRIAHQGYVTTQRRVRIGATQTAQSIEVAMEATRPARPAAASSTASDHASGVPADARGATVGSLMVDSRPAGARVFVDGKMVGTTPALLDAVGAGDHTVRLELDGFSPWTATSKVAGGERTRVSGSLEQR